MIHYTKWLAMGVLVGVSCFVAGKRLPQFHVARAATALTASDASKARPRPEDMALPQVDHLAAGEHPLTPIVQWGRKGLPVIEGIHDYSARFVKRERVGGQLGRREVSYIKIRHHPFSVFMRGVSPASIRGQEVLYVAGQNDGKLWAHPAGIQGRLVHVVSIDPKGDLAMRNQRYPITEIGILSLVRQLVEAGEQDLLHGDCQVKTFDNVTVNGRPCTLFEILHSTRQKYFRYHIARIFADEQIKIPIRYEAYRWPSKQDGPPELIEEYSYLDLKFNNGFTDKDFSIENPAYHFR